MSEHQRPPSVSPPTVRKIVIALVVVCVGLILADLCFLLDFTPSKTVHADFELIPGFHAAYGFISYVLLVLLATQLRRLLMRSEDYYDD
jgi:hypothetical protein